MSTHLESKDLMNAQQMEVAVNGPDGATHLIICTGIANLGSCSLGTFTFLVGPQLSRRQFVGAIASGAISTIQTENKKLMEDATDLHLEANIVLIDANYDAESSYVEVRAEIACGLEMTKLAISYNVSILAELPIL